MRKLLTITCFSILGMFFSSCLHDNAYIQVWNTSEYDYEKIIIRKTDYGNLAAGEKSDYLRLPGAYRYAYVELLIDGEKYIIQPEDFVGEKRLWIGRYIYAIQADTSTETCGRLSLKLLKP